MAFIAVVAALAALNMASAFPHATHHPHCPAPLPEIHPIVVQSEIPAPVNIGPASPGTIEHCSAPIEINYFEKPWIVKHKQSAALHVYTQEPVVVDAYEHPEFHESAAPAAVIVEEVCAAPAPVCAAPAPVCAAPAPVCAAPAPCYY